MPTWAGVFNGIAWVYVGIAGWTVLRLLRSGRAAFDQELTPAGRRLVGAAAFYLATPPAVVLHELGHCVAVWLLGGRIVGWHFLFYWGYVVPDRSFGAYGDLFVALAGNLVTVAIGAAALVKVFRRPGRASWNFFLARIAEIQLSIALVFYPAMCLIGLPGDFQAIYRLSTAPVSAPLLAVHLAALVLLWKARSGRAGATLRLLTGPLWDEVRAAREAVARDPGDVVSLLKIGWAHLAVGLPAQARSPIEAALARRPDLPAAHAMLGQALATEAPDRAEVELSRALACTSLDPLLAATSHLSLARVKLDGGEAGGALSHACAALRGLPRDPEAARLVWEAAEAAGKTGPDVQAVLDLAVTRGNAVARRGLEALERIARRQALAP